MFEPTPTPDMRKLSVRSQVFEDWYRSEYIDDLVPQPPDPERKAASQLAYIAGSHYGQEMARVVLELALGVVAIPPAPPTSGPEQPERDERQQEMALPEAAS